jgi:hypothetical protein
MPTIRDRCIEEEEKKKPNITIVIACSPKGDRGNPASEATSKKNGSHHNLVACM